MVVAMTSTTTNEYPVTGCDFARLSAETGRPQRTTEGDALCGREACPRDSGGLVSL